MCEIFRLIEAEVAKGGVIGFSWEDRKTLTDGPALLGDLSSRASLTRRFRVSRPHAVDIDKLLYLPKRQLDASRLAAVADLL